MTLFIRNRGMPTLSLEAKSRTELSSGAWGRVCVPLFLFILVLSQIITSPLFAQDLHNRTEDMFHLGRVIITKEPLSDKVFQAQKSKVLISVIFVEKGTEKTINNSLGTGFLSKIPGVIITARHLLDTALVDMERMKNNIIKSNPKFDYDYVLMGTIITSSEWINFPLSLIAIGERSTFKDIMVLKIDTQTMQKAGEISILNPYKILTKTLKFANANIGDEVYISGFAPVVSEYLDKNGGKIPVYVDLINHTFPAEVEVPIFDMPVNRAGIEKIYRLRDGAEPGFSGGMVLNNNGEVIGMTIATSISKNFVYAISSKDIEQFLKDHKIK